MAAHGSNPAAWTGVSLVLVGFVLGGIALTIGPDWMLFWIGLACIGLGAIVGKVLQAMGLGQESPSQETGR